jgi:acetaldehyde dehydrogenase (acetylating)
MKKLRVAILGSGNIGTDLLVKIRRSKSLECTLFIGRNLASKGILAARELGVPTSDQSIEAIVRTPDCCDLVFDCTSAAEHVKHWPVLQKLGKRVIDMTPSKVGQMAVPAINLDRVKDAANVNMVSCGGQASIPVAYAISQSQPGIEYIEVVSSIASKSAGPATRVNLDEYIETTEAALKTFCQCPDTKTLLILNPAEPPVNMQTTISAKVKSADLDRVRPAVEAMVAKIQRYVPGYQLLVPPVFEHNRIVAMIKVTGLGDYLPPYSGNLDIINCAAIATAEFFAGAEA